MNTWGTRIIILVVGLAIALSLCILGVAILANTRTAQLLVSGGAPTVSVPTVSTNGGQVAPTPRPGVQPTQPVATVQSVQPVQSNIVAFYDVLFLWKNGARHSELPTGPNGPDIFWLVHGDIGYDHTCNWTVLENTGQVASLYPGTFRLVGIRGGTLADRVAFAQDRVINIGQPCQAR